MTNFPLLEVNFSPSGPHEGGTVVWRPGFLIDSTEEVAFWLEKPIRFPYL
jgi:hypothetical protein